MYVFNFLRGSKPKGDVRQKKSVQNIETYSGSIFRLTLGAITFPPSPLLKYYTCFQETFP